MKPARPSRAAFTLIELLVVISIIGILATLAVPAVNNALVQGQMTGTLNNARQLQIATQQMALDTANTGEGISWTTTNSNNGGSQPVGLNAFFTALTTNNYLSVADLRKVLTAPGVSPGNAVSNFTKGNIAFNIFEVSEQSPSDQPFVVTANWTGRGNLTNNAPYGKKGFVVFAKGGSGGIYKRVQDASSTNIFPSSSGANNDGSTYSLNFLN